MPSAPMKLRITSKACEGVSVAICDPIFFRLCACVGSLALHAICLALAINITPLMARNNIGALSGELTLELIGLPSDIMYDSVKFEAAEAPAVVTQELGSGQTFISESLLNSESIPLKSNEDLSLLEENTKTDVQGPSLSQTVESILTTPQSAHDVFHRGVPNEDSQETSERNILDWQKQLFAHLNRFKRYPSNSSQLSGEVILTFVLDASGHVVSATVLKNSGKPALDKAALEMMLKSNPVPPPPLNVIKRGLSFTIPVTFRSKNTRK